MSDDYWKDLPKNEKVELMCRYVAKWDTETLDYHLGEEIFSAKENGTEHHIFEQSVDEMLSFIKDMLRPQE